MRIATAPRQFHVVLGGRLPVPVTVNVAADRTLVEASEAVRTVEFAVGRLGALVGWQALSQLRRGFELQVQSATDLIDARGGPTEIELGGRTAHGICARSAHDQLDVVAHELGHVIWSRTVARPEPRDKRGAVARALSESFGDVLALAVTDDPRVGEGLTQLRDPLRSIGAPSATSVAAARALLRTSTNGDEQAGYALGEFVTRAFWRARETVGEEAIRAWFGAAAHHGRESRSLGAGELLPAFRAATIANAETERGRRAITRAWADALAPLG